MIRFRLIRLLLSIAILGLAVFAHAIPGSISIDGRLLGANGEPVRYWQGTGGNRVEISVILPAKISFFDSATNRTAFSTLLTSATAQGGFFHIQIPLPDAALSKDGLWYTLAIDADRNGLGANDSFTERFEIGAVPFALTAKPLKSFTILGGFHGTGHSGGSNLKKMMVCPFETPAGGIEFNQMNILLMRGEPGDAFSFGVYDDTGKRVASSGIVTIPGGMTSFEQTFLQVKSPETQLQPSRTYYIGLAMNESISLIFPSGEVPVAPIMGNIPIGNSSGDVPASFDPDRIDADPNIIALPVTFCLVANPGTNGWVTPKPGGPSYRWIPVNSSAKGGTGPGLIIP